MIAEEFGKIVDNKIQTALEPIQQRLDAMEKAHGSSKRAASAPSGKFKALRLMPPTLWFCLQCLCIEFGTGKALEGFMRRAVSNARKNVTTVFQIQETALLRCFKSKKKRHFCVSYLRKNDILKFQTRNKPLLRYPRKRISSVFQIQEKNVPLVFQIQ